MHQSKHGWLSRCSLSITSPFRRNIIEAFFAQMDGSDNSLKCFLKEDFVTQSTEINMVQFQMNSKSLIHSTFLSIFYVEASSSEIYLHPSRIQKNWVYIWAQYIPPHSSMVQHLINIESVSLDAMLPALWIWDSHSVTSHSTYPCSRWVRHNFTDFIKLHSISSVLNLEHQVDWIALWRKTIR